MPTVYVSPFGPAPQFELSSGVPAVGNKLFFYVAGTTTKQDTYTDSTGTVANTNPVILDSLGMPNSTQIWFEGGKTYKVVYAPSTDTDPPSSPIKTWDNLDGQNDSGFLQAGTGAVPRTSQDKEREIISITDFVLSSDGADKYRLAFERAKALAATTLAGAFIFIPAMGSAYTFTVGAGQTDEAGTNYPAITMTSNMHVWASPGATFKMADSQSTNGSPKNISMFFSNSTLSNISFHNLTIDMNGANNLQNAGLRTMAHILFSGTPAGVAARGDDVLIEGCKFLNTSGVTCIGMAQSNTASVTLGKRWTIRDCLFNNNGLDTVDHSSIYAWADYVDCYGCVATADTMWGTTPNKGALVFYEMHGANQRVFGNAINNYYQGFWVAGNYTSASSNCVFSGNTVGPVLGVGFDFFRETSTTPAVSNIVITNNTITLTDGATAITLKVGVQIAASYKINGVLVAGNTATKTGTSVGSSFFSIGPQSVAAQKHTDVIVSGNYANGFTFGALVSTNATNGLGRVTIGGNHFVGLAGAGAFATPIGITGANINAASPVDSLVLMPNVIDTATYGVYLSGTVTNLNVLPQAYQNVSTQDYLETSFTATVRKGFYRAIVFTPAWKSSGVAVTVGNGSIQGQYSIVDTNNVRIDARFSLGGTSVIPAGSITLDAPFTSATAGIAYIGTWRLFDSSTAINYSGFCVLDGTGGTISLFQSGGGNLTNASPVVIATSDVIQLSLNYTR